MVLTQTSKQIVSTFLRARSRLRTAKSVAWQLFHNINCLYGKKVHSKSQSSDKMTKQRMS
ncbi:CLUMA_CG014664, isoform A [Clunio marinus]|uniref:CLUMA_CG014664, isoform A n=1 Tax=Clunio marinus TaxID=568069 RepID=A0A1J1ILJ8_9DIPT|nr:CLUMA_CG014664, isoform A [Clunio marinus]